MLHKFLGFPSVLGIIDCTHCKVLVPKDQEHHYINRKHQKTLNVLVIIIFLFSFCLYIIPLEINIHWHSWIIFRWSVVKENWPMYVPDGLDQRMTHLYSEIVRLNLFSKQVKFITINVERVKNYFMLPPLFVFFLRWWPAWSSNRRQRISASDLPSNPIWCGRYTCQATIQFPFIKNTMRNWTNVWDIEEEISSYKRHAILSWEVRN